MGRLRASSSNADHADQYSPYRLFFAFTGYALGAHESPFCVATYFHRFENYS